MKKVICLLLSFCMIFCMFTFLGNTVSAATTKTKDEAISWLNGLVGTKVGSGECVALIQAYYEYLGAPTPYGNGCDYATNSLPSGWTHIAGATPQAGDILVWTEGYENCGHVAICADTNRYFHQNFPVGAFVNVLEKSYTGGFSTSKGYANYWGVIRPDFKTSTLNCPKPSMSMLSANIQNIDTNSCLKLSWTATSNTSYYNLKYVYNGVTNTFATNLTETEYYTRLAVPGTYYFYIDSCYNAESYTQSNILAINVTLASQQIIADGWYTIANFKDENIVVEASEESSNVQLGIYNIRNKNQKVYFKHIEDGYYTITFANSNNNMDVADAVNASETNVQNVKNNGHKAQQWMPIPTGDGYFFLKSRLGNIFIDAQDGQIFGGTNIWVYTPNFTFAQRWKLVSESNQADITTKATTPDLVSKTQNKVTLKSVTGCEYSKNGISWQSSPVFTGLKANTSYTFYQRYAETDTKYAGVKSNGLTVKTYPSGSLLIYEGGKWYHYKNGVRQYNTRLIKHTNGRWYYVRNGIKQTTTGFVKHTNGKYYYVKNGIWQSSYKGLVKYSGKWYYAEKGIRQYNTGLVKHTDGRWYYVSNGIFNNTTGFVKHSGKYYYVKSGIWQSSYKGLVKQNGKWYYTVKGVRQYTTQLARHTDGNQYYVKNGIMQKVTGLVKIGSKRYYIKNGIFQRITATVKIGGKRYKLVKGVVQ